MLNRHHARIKVMQALYSYYVNDDPQNLHYFEKELMNNIYRLYQTYLYLLLLIKEISSFAERYDDEIQANIPGTRLLTPNQKFYNNSLIKALRNNTVLEKACEKYGVFFNPEHVEILRKVFVDLKNNETYREYIKNENFDVIDDLEILTFFLKYYTSNFTLLDTHLEDIFINWPDDSKAAVNMAVKSLKLLTADINTQDILVPLSNEEEATLEFSKNLFYTCINHQAEFEELIKGKIQKWDFSRLPLVDIIILQMGLSELLYFETIPVKVTINECIELAKNYSTHNSKSFINGILDNLIKSLNNEGRIIKKGIGLIDT